MTLLLTIPAQFAFAPQVVIIPGFFILVAYGVLVASRLHQRLSRSQPSLMSQVAGGQDRQDHHDDDCDHSVT